MATQTTLNVYGASYYRRRPNNKSTGGARKNMDEEKKNQASQQREEEPQRFVEDEDGNRAAATPEEEQVHPLMQGAPGASEDYVGQLEPFVDPDPMAEAERQVRENYPRVRGDEFDPSEVEPEEARPGRAATSRADFGRVVVVEDDVLYDNEIYKAGVQELPLDVADALISQGDAFEPAGKKKGL